MSANSAKSTACLGFLTVVENDQLGLLGGYLLLNPAGRPLEFHCTAPVKASRTQEILYGPTLRPFLYGEQIGQTLLTKSKLSPLAVCTDCPDMLAARDFTHLALLLVLGDQSLPPLAELPTPTPFRLAKSEVLTAPHYSSDEQAIKGAWPAQADQLDLAEPFARIREALDEAQKSARQAA
jgi:hypothetical protein